MGTAVITSQEIEEILQKYCIGKKPLAKLLGWGEVTIIRYLEGDKPSRAYSDKLREIYHSPKCYFQLLNTNRENITQAAYERSQNALYQYVIRSKIYVAAYYLKSQWEDFLPIEGFRCLLYYAQGFSLSMYKKPLFKEEYKVTPSGIPYEEIMEMMSDDFWIPVEILEKYLSVKEQDLLKAIVKAFRWYGNLTLKTIMKAENSSLRISRSKQNERIVSMDTLEKHFQWIIKEYRILKPEDVWKYIDSKFAETRKWKTIMPW